MNRTYETQLTLACFDATNAECNVPVIITYKVDLGTPASGQFGPPEHYDPGSADGIDFLSIVIRRPDGKFEVMPEWQADKLFISNEDFRDILIGEWKANLSDKASDRADYLYDRYRDRLMEERFERKRAVA